MVSYAGDARLSAFPIGEQRLAGPMHWTRRSRLSATRRRPIGWPHGNEIRKTACCGYSRVVRQTTTFFIAGPAREPRQLVVLQRRLPGWTLTKPDAKGIELSEGSYRIPFQLPGGDQTQAFEVAQEQTQHQELRLLDTGSDQIKVFAQAQEFDAKTREALTRILQLQQAVGEAERKVTQVDAERQHIVQEQAGIRGQSRFLSAGQQRSAAPLPRDPRQAGDRAGSDRQAPRRRREGRAGGSRHAAELRVTAGLNMLGALSLQ